MKLIYHKTNPVGNSASYYHSFVCFVFINLIPSDPAEVALRIRQVPIITEEAVAQVRRELGLDKPYLDTIYFLAG